MLFMMGLPIHFALSYAMPVHLTLSVLSYFAALSIPQRFKRFLHPVLVSSMLTILGIWILALIHRTSLFSSLRLYATKSRYIQLLDGGASHLPPPGAGDIFSSALDVSIVALALPMFQYRNELKRHFTSIILPNILIATGSLFGYPALCHAIGISPSRSLSFASRSLTLGM